jgi:ribosomal protein L24
MDIRLNDKVKILSGPHAGKIGTVVDIPREYEEPDRFYIVDVDGFRAEVPESSIAKDRKFLWMLLGFAIGTAVAAVLVRGGV